MGCSSSSFFPVQASLSILKGNVICWFRTISSSFGVVDYAKVGINSLMFSQTHALMFLQVHRLYCFVMLENDNWLVKTCGLLVLMLV